MEKDELRYGHSVLLVGLGLPERKAGEVGAE